MASGGRMERHVAAGEWQKIGSFADCDILAHGSRRRLVDRDGTVIIEFDVER